MDSREPWLHLSVRIADYRIRPAAGGEVALEFISDELGVPLAAIYLNAEQLDKLLDEVQTAVQLLQG
jgi:hypothetical protein